MSEQKEQPSFEEIVSSIVNDATTRIKRTTDPEIASAVERAKEAFINSGQLPPLSLESLTPGEQLTLLTKWSGMKGPQGQEMFHQWYEFNSWKVVNVQQGSQPGVLIEGIVPKGSHQQSHQRLLTPDGFKFFTNAEGLGQLNNFSQGVAQSIKGK